MILCSAVCECKRKTFLKTFYPEDKNSISSPNLLFHNKNFKIVKQYIKPIKYINLHYLLFICWLRPMRPIR